MSGRNGDHEWIRMINAFILCDLVWKVLKSHAANREGSFKLIGECKVSCTQLPVFVKLGVHVKGAHQSQLTVLVQQLCYKEALNLMI